jgi:hypothetical protein
VIGTKGRALKYSRLSRSYQAQHALVVCDTAIASLLITNNASHTPSTQSRQSQSPRLWKYPVHARPLLRHPPAPPLGARPAPSARGRLVQAAPAPGRVAGGLVPGVFALHPGNRRVPTVPACDHTMTEPRSPVAARPADDPMRRNPRRRRKSRRR